MRAAVAAGADAVYFGLRSGFNARAKAENVSTAELPGVMEMLHGQGVRGYVTFNTLVFQDEMVQAAEELRSIARAGVDAVIVQDLGVARLCRHVCPDLPVHASTQMTVSSPGAAHVVAGLGVRRVVLPRELTLEEVARLHQESPLELEAFVHGALCMSYSGQCLASEAFGGRSANRGLCAQSCRLPYGLVVDGVARVSPRPLYPLSPKDLLALERLPGLWKAGVTSFKIEGRLKDLSYVSAVVAQYRRAVDAMLAGQPAVLDEEARDALTFTFSRGASRGFLDGDDHQDLVHGEQPGHRGALLGTVEGALGDQVTVAPSPGAVPVKPGDWVVFDQGDPEGDPPRGGVFQALEGTRGRVVLGFGRPGPDVGRIRAGDRVFKTHDAALERRLRRAGDNQRKVAVDLWVSGAAGQPLAVRARDALGREALVHSDVVLREARDRPLDREVAREKLGGLGNTTLVLGDLDFRVEGQVALPPSELKRLRRAFCAALEQAAVLHPAREVHDSHPVADGLEPVPGPPVLSVLCRTVEQVEAVLALGCRDVVLDLWPAQHAVTLCRASGARVTLATTRVQKPAEEDLTTRLLALQPDGLLVRHLGAVHLARAAGAPVTLRGDFSLNVTNGLTAGWLLAGLGLESVTASHDLDVDQLLGLATSLPPGRLEVVAYHHVTLFHDQHCLFARHLSPGHNRTDCGRPCDKHVLRLRDRVGLDHVVEADVACRNTVFHAQAQSAAPVVPRLLKAGVTRFRVDLLDEPPDVTRGIVGIHQDLFSGRVTAREASRSLQELEPRGVGLGTLRATAHGGRPP
jgi:putative protease